MSQATNQSWGGRFSEPTDAFVARFTASVNFDQRLARQDIQGSIAHATMLARVGVLTEEERDAIINGLTDIQGEIERGEFNWSVPLRRAHEHRSTPDRQNRHYRQEAAHRPLAQRPSGHRYSPVHAR